MTRGESVLFCNHHLALKQHAGAMQNMSVLTGQTGDFKGQDDQQQTGGLTAMPERLDPKEYEKWAPLYNQLMLETRELEELKAEYGISDHPWYRHGFHKQKGVQKF
jgi:hypothetical protein